ncbi:MAG: IPT/TIG domain-containing protein, partial [Myxococcota bacterium]
RARVFEASPTRLLVGVPRGGTTGPFTVDSRGRGQASSQGAFVVQEPPVATRYAPRYGPPGTLVTLEGNHFGRNLRALQVTLSGVPARVRDLGPRRIVVEVPAGVAGGQWEVSVSGLRAVWAEPYGATATLRVDRVDPPAAGPGAEVHIYGQGFDPDPAGDVVRLSGVTGQVVSATPDQLVVIVPRAPSGPLEVQAYGQSARLRGIFNAAAQPTIVALVPEAGTVGTTLEIRGANFGSRRALVDVRLAGRAVAVQSVRDDRVVVVVPPGARSGLVQVTIGARGGATSPRRFEVLGDAGVAGLLPSSGYEGTELTLRGQGFPRGPLMVQFPGARPVAADRRGPLELRVRVPRGATTGAVQVVLPDGRTLNAGRFQVVPTPVGVGVTAIEPECAFSGCAATLRGYGFASNPASNRVRFNGQSVRVRTASPTAIVITLPAQAGNGRFQVRVRRRGEAQSPPFYVQPR